MSHLTGVARRLLRRIELFSQYVLRMPLYEYQLAPLRAIVDSVRKQQGHDFLLIFPRQSGKNEAIAHLLVYLLNLFQRSGGAIVFAAIGDAVGRGLRRLEERLENSWNEGRWRKGARPLRRTLGQASVVFLSSHPGAHARGETAHWLLVVDELQDNDAAHLEAVFEPMRAANNATAVYIGTVRFRSDALWQKKLALEQLQAEDGLRRVFMVTPEEVTAANPAYGRFLERKLARLGRDHPIVRSEYFLQPIDADGGLFPPRRRRLMQGRHPRLETPDDAALYVATLDVGGQDEAATDPVARLQNPGRDYTVATIFEVVAGEGDRDGPGGLPGPTYRAVDVFVDHGSRHFQDAPGRPALVKRLCAFLQQWRVAHVVADATGVGEGVVDWLAASLGAARVTPFKFGQISKAQLGNRFLSLVETGRFHYWADEYEGAAGERARPYSDAWWFWQQCRHCTYQVPPGGAFDRHLSWGVPQTARVSTPQGPRPVHDDRLLSAALVAEYDRLIREGAVSVGRGESVVIPPLDPLREMGF
ncbi:MAG: hypothetical protein ACOC9X_06740 [bacterium]